MQDEVNQKTVALSIRATKLTGRVLASAIWKILEEGKKRHQKALTPQGRQSVKKLMNHYGAKNSMPLVGAPRQFDRIAKEFHVDYAFHKVSPGHYLLFFKAGQADAMTAAFQKYSPTSPTSLYSGSSQRWGRLTAWPPEPISARSS